MCSALALLLSLQNQAIPNSDIVDADSIPQLKPQVVERADANDRMTPEVTARYGLFHRTGSETSFSWDSAHDATSQYERFYPYPEMRYVPVKPFSPFQHDSGIKRVEAFRRQWKRTEKGYEVVEKILWQWETPKDLQNSLVVNTNYSLKDRFMSLILYPIGSKLRAPILCYFGAEKGLIWRREISLPEAYTGAKSKVTLPTGEQEDELPVVTAQEAAMSADGLRTMVIVPFQQPCLSLIFIYDNQGNLLRNAIIPKRFSRHSQFFQRTPNGNHLILRFEQRYYSDDAGRKILHWENEDYFADFDGNLLCRFPLSQAGHIFPNVTVSSNDRYAAFLEDKTHEQTIFELPK